MFEYEFHKMHTADLMREADVQRLIREARRAQRPRNHESQGPVSSLRARFVRAA